MRITKLHYVFSFIFILSLCLTNTTFAKKKGKIQKGLATWYGTHFHGKPTTSGEVYNKHRMTAAHPSLPFGTKVKVTNQESKKSVIVRINDRGPFGNKRRIIDLSEAAARKIDLYEDGSAPVTVEIIPAYASSRVKKSKARTLAKAAKPTKTPEAELKPATAPTPEPAPQVVQFEPNKNTLNIQPLVYTLLKDSFYSTDARKNLNFRQHLAFREEELNSYWVQRVLANQLGSRAQAEEYTSRLGKSGISDLAIQLPQAS